MWSGEDKIIHIELTVPLEEGCEQALERKEHQKNTKSFCWRADGLTGTVRKAVESASYWFWSRMRGSAGSREEEMGGDLATAEGVVIRG